MAEQDIKHGVLIIDQSGVIVAANENAAAMVGLEWTIFLKSFGQSGQTNLKAAMETIREGSISEMAGRCVGSFLNYEDVGWNWRLSRLAALDANSVFSLDIVGAALDSNAKPSCSDISAQRFEDPEFAVSGEGVISLHSYRETFEHAVEGIFRTTLDGQYIDVNPSLAVMYGFEKPEDLILAMRDLNTQLYVDSGRRNEFVRLMRKDGLVRDFTSEVYRSDGSRIWISEYARTVLNKQGKAIFYEGSVVDITKHRLAEENLRQSEEKFRLLVETMDLLPWEADLDTRRFRYVGPQAAEFLGFPIEEWRDENFWRSRIHPQDLEWVEVVHAEALEKSNSFESEYRMIRADGRIIWVRDMMRVMSSSAGRVLGGFMLDVSYRRETETSLQESQYFFERLIDASPVIFYLFDMSRQRCVHINGRVEAILGYSAEALYEMNPHFVEVLGHPDEAEGHALHLKRLAQCRKGETIERDFRLRAAGGNWVWLRSRESVFESADSGNPLRIVGTATDNTVRRMAFEELVNNETLFRNLAENIKAIPFEYDIRANRFSYVGPQELSIVGYPITAWYHQGFLATIIHPDDIVAGMQFVTLKRSHLEMDLHTEFRLRKTNGEYVWLAQIARRAEEGEDHPQVRGFFFDITETKEREKEISTSRELMRQLASRVHEAREEERKNIARELHDELGQALTIFRIELEWLETRFGRLSVSDSAISAKLPEMKKMADTTLQTVRRILTALRPPILDEFGLAAAIEWHMGEFSRRVGIRCELQKETIEDVDPYVATAVFRIFQEILTNIARHARASNVKVKFQQDGGAVVLSVSDNGKGFLASESNGEKKSFGLLGMRERADHLRGKLTIVSTVGAGTNVTLLLPLNALKSKPSHQSPVN